MLKLGLLMSLVVLTSACGGPPPTPEMSRDEALAIARKRLPGPRTADTEPRMAMEFDKIWVLEWMDITKDNYEATVVIDKRNRQVLAAYGGQ